MNNRGFVLITSLLFMLVLAILTVMALTVTTVDYRIAAANQSIEQVFLQAEGGVEEARSRLQSTSPNKILDTMTNNAGCKVFIGPLDKAQAQGYTGGAGQSRVDSVTGMTNVTTISHKVSSGQVMYWGDTNGDGVPEENPVSGTNIYVILSEGYDATGSSKKVEIEVTPMPPVSMPAALYAKDVIVINGSSTEIHGKDLCSGVDVPGVLTRQTVSISGKPTIEGEPPIIQNDPTDIDIRGMINTLRSYTTAIVPAGNVNNANFGTPTLVTGRTDGLLQCSDKNVVYARGDVTFAGTSKGCGILMVDGNLTAHDLTWYGIILVTGQIKFEGGGQKNVTGVIMSGGNSVTVDDTFGGNSVLNYCSQAIQAQTQNRPLKVLRWRQL
ncbi:MAG TPA: hypothetical protein VLS90_00840 [Thermodesulfobacteriota bacterium]|nr:hypothetical protein [Thermodesulfobacteriota bacterium]